ncbi:MAG: hypothetical protein IJZ82_07635 [Lachnospiraceae bacterium]|nr:hypothetical protein [Lachnospiraceae bacterium]
MQRLRFYLLALVMGVMLMVHGQAASAQTAGEVKEIVLGEVSEITAEDYLLEIEINEPGVYKAIKTGDFNLFLGKKSEIIWDEVVFDSMGKHTLSVTGAESEYMSLQIVKLETKGFPIGEKYTLDVTSEAQYFSFSLSESGNYTVMLDSKDGGKSGTDQTTIAIASNGTFSDYNYAFTDGSKEQIQLEKDLTYYIKVYFGSSEKAEQYELLLQRDLKAIAVEVVREPYKTIFYYGVEYATSGECGGYILGLTLEDGSYIEVEQGDANAEKYIGFVDCYNADGSYVERDEHGKWPVGNYYWSVLVGADRELECKIPYKIEGLEKVDKELTLQKNVKGLFGIEYTPSGSSADIYKDYWNVIRVKIDSPGKYLFDTDANISTMYLYDESGLVDLTSGLGMEMYDFAESGTYYLVVSACQNNYSVFLSEAETVIDIKINNKLPESVLTSKVMEETGCSTVDELSAFLKNTLVTNSEATKILSGINFTDTMIKDIVLVESTDNGNSWENVTVFPEEGIDIVIPYPGGTASDTHDYVIGHLQVEGTNAGEMEFFEPQEASEGLKIHVYSTSPFVVGWKKTGVEPTSTPEPTGTPVPTSAPEPTDTPAPTSTPESTGTPAPASTPEPTATPTVKPVAPSGNNSQMSSGQNGEAELGSMEDMQTSPKTSDVDYFNMGRMMLLIGMIAGVSCIGAVAIKKRKN